MGQAWELIGGAVSDPSTSYTAVTMATGDSLTVRNFPPTNPAYLVGLHRQDATSGVTRVRSPLLHDNVKGYHIATAENPLNYGIPFALMQQLRPQDTLILEVTGSASTYDVAGLSIYYTNLPGQSARLHSWGDIAGIQKSIVTVEIATTAAAAPSVWTDTVITTTDNLLHANTDYAVIGYGVDTAVGLVAIKGIDTGNLRVGSAGKNLMYETADYFVRESIARGLPMIPVFNSANAPSTYVSVLTLGNATTTNITLFLAELANNLPN